MSTDTISMNESRSPRDYLDEAKDPSTTPQRLRELSKKEWPFVRAAVARHPNTEADVVAGMMPDRLTWQDEELALAIAGRSDVPEPVLRKLAEEVTRLLSPTHPALMVDATRALFRNSTTPLDVLKNTLTSKNCTRQFRASLASQAVRVDVLRILQNDVSGVVSARAKRRLQVIHGERGSL